MKQKKFTNHDVLRYALTSAFLFLFPLMMFAQGITVKGTVTDAVTNKPIPYVNVVVKGTNLGATTNVEGAYSIKVPSTKDILVFSFVGYANVEKSVYGLKTINVKMFPNVQNLNQVVVLGYSTLKKKDLTGAVSVINAKKIGNSSYPNVVQAIQGMASGINVTEDGQPGPGRTSITIRGLTTLNNNQPLYVIDGVATTGDGLNDIDPNDIKSIQILKDAASASIYGSRSAGGVIVITTKQGKPGQMKVDAGVQTGMQTVARTISVLNATQWGKVYWQAAKNDGIQPNLPYMYGNGPNPVINTQPFTIPNGRQIYQYTLQGTDWTKEVYHNASSTQAYFNLSNGNKKGSYFLGASYYGQNGLIIYTYYNRYTVRMNSNFNLFKWLKVGENMSVATSKQVQGGTQQSQDGIPTDVIRQNPLLPVYDIQGNFAGKISAFPDVRNMVSVLQKNKNNWNKANSLFGDFHLQANIFEPFSSHFKHQSLIFNSKFGINYSSYYNRNFQADYQEGDYDILSNSLSNAYGRGLTTTIINTLTYNLNLNKNHLKVLAGSETDKYDYTFLSGTRTGFELSNPSFTYLNAGSGDQTNGGGGTSWGLFSYFGRIDYNFADKYLLSTTLRYDKTSRFKSTGTFPAASFGWRITNEPFMKSLLKNNILSNMKLRVGYGEQGNQNSYDFAYLSLLGANVNNANYDINGTNNSVVQGLEVIQRGNPNLKWETTKQLDVGTDIGLFSGQLGITFDYYIKNTTGILLPVPQIAAIGEGAAPYSNSAGVSNKGYEVDINYHFYNKHGLSVNAKLFVSQYKNKVVSLPETSPIGYDSIRYINGQDGNYRTIVGQPMAEFYGYVADGIFQNQQQVDNHAAQPGAAVGRIRYKDINGDGVINAKDRTNLGSPYPKITLGLNLDVNYKNFSLSMIFYSELGQKIYNYNKWYLDFAQSGTFNHGTAILNAWTPTNTNTNIPALTLTNNNNENRISSYFIENGSFLKLRTARLDYKIPTKSIKHDYYINVYAEVQNAFTITKYSGIDPEVPYEGGNMNVPGIDRGAYPMPRTFVLGLKVGF